jgi:hypothetical protein
MKTGSCLCGAVKFECDEPLRPIVICHCTQCRKQTGSVMHATAVDNEHLRMTETRGLKWYRASSWAQRGFCGECGSSMFWKPDNGKHTSFSAGSLDDATGLAIEGHIFCADKGDYYEIPTSEGYQRQQWKS